jgi:glycosyltransferase 2 family protein
MTEQAQPSRRAALLRAGRPAFLVVAIALGIWAIVSERHKLGHAFAQVSWGWVVAAYAVVLAGTALSVLVFRELLAGLGSPIPLSAVARVVYLGQLGKYLPGSVWAVLGQTELAREYDVPRTRGLVTSLVGIVLSVLCGLLVAAVFLPLSSGRALTHYWWALLAIPVLVCALAPPVLNPMVNRLLRLFRRPELDRPFALPSLLRAASWQLAMWLLIGVQGYLLVAGIGAPGGRSFFIAVGGFALAFAAGLLVIPAPAGAGVRETALVAALSPVLHVGPALAVALLSRALSTLADLTLAVGAVARARAHARTLAAQETSTNQ